VLTIWSFRGELDGWFSAAPTSATREVQNSISTIPVAPWSAGEVSEIWVGPPRGMPGQSSGMGLGFASGARTRAADSLFEWTLPKGSQLRIV
jgi:hypothetical protein